MKITIQIDPASMSINELDSIIEQSAEIRISGHPIIEGKICEIITPQGRIINGDIDRESLAPSTGSIAQDGIAPRGSLIPVSIDR